jgi:hypothetical protein
MKRVGTLLLIAALFSGNCAARGARTAMRSQDPPALWQQYASKLAVGSPVRVGTTDGDRFKATLLVVDATGITVKPMTRVPEPPRHVAFSQLAQLEPQATGSSSGDRIAAVAIGVATGTGVFLGSLFLLFALFGD